MPRILLMATPSMFSRWLAESLAGSPGIEACRLMPVDGSMDADRVANQTSQLIEQERLDRLAIRPQAGKSLDFHPSATQTKAALMASAGQGLCQAILFSSTSVYPPSHHHPGHVGESHRLRRAENSLSKAWQGLEKAFFRAGKRAGVATLALRCAEVAGPHSDGYLNRLLSRPVAVTAAGFDPSLQLLHREDLLEALLQAVRQRAEGCCNLVPDGVIPLRQALKLAGSRRLPLPYSLQQAVRPLLSRLGLAAHRSQVEYLRYPNTASGQKIESQIGFRPRYSSRQAVASQAGRSAGHSKAEEEFDKFGMDRQYIQTYGRTLFRFLHNAYWRIEERGLEHIPRQGRAVLVGIHRGFMPWDAVMLLHSIVQQTRRYPRFLIHPCLVKFPGLANYMTKLGGILASQENADWVLQQDEILGVYPEGIRGAFTMYRNAYKLGNFGRNDFVRIALRNRAPLIPAVTVGSAEIYPILGRIDWRWWKRLSEWPFLPLTPTFPWIPFPLPSKWHTQFLAPLHVEKEFPPQAADDPEVVQQISLRVQECFERAFEEMLKARRSVFYGSIFRGKHQNGFATVDSAITRRAH